MRILKEIYTAKEYSVHRSKRNMSKQQGYITTLNKLQCFNKRVHTYKFYLMSFLFSCFQHISSPYLLYHISMKKYVFSKKCLFSIPLRTLCGLCVLAKPLGVLSRHPCRIPKPLPHGKGCVCFVGSASCRAFGHTRPASVPGLNVGLPPSPSKDA